MNATRFVARASLLLASVSLACCGGGAGSSSGAPVPNAPKSAMASVTLRLAIPGSSSRSLRSKRAQFVAASTRGILVQTYAQSDTTHSNVLSSVATDVSPGSPACGGVNNALRMCTVAFNAPGGADTFVVTSYDAAPSGGSFTGAKQLAAAVVAQTLTTGASATIKATLGGIVSSINVVSQYPNVHGTVASTQTIYVEPYDADGNLVVSDAFSDALGNAAPIALSFSSNPGNMFSLSTASLTSPALSGVRVSYNGQAPLGTNLGTSVDAKSGSITGSVDINLSGPIFYTYTIGSSGNQASFLSVAPSSAQSPFVWYTDYGASRFGGILVSGFSHTYALAPGSAPQGIAPGPNGYLWMCDFGTSKIESRDTSGVQHNLISTISPNAGPLGIVEGPDGNLWFTESAVGRIGMSTPSGVVTEYLVGGTSVPELITVGPDGNLWFTDSGNNAIGKITTAGVITEYSTGMTGGATPYGIAAGSDGNLWFTERTRNQIGVITTSGTFLHEYVIPTAASQPTTITSGPDGNMWFTEYAGEKLARISAIGKIDEWPVTGSPGPTGIVVGPDNDLWFGAGGASIVGTFAW